MRGFKAKRVFSALVCMALAVSNLANFSTPDVASADALSGLDSWQITQKMTVGWNLGNSLDCSASWLNMYSNSPSDFAKSWGNPEPTYDLIKAVKNSGFNTIRIPTTWYQHVYYDGENYVIDDEWLNYVKKFVDYAYEMDMFVILNVHHEEGIINVSEFNDGTLSVAKTWLEDVWQQIAEEFKNYDQHLIFEGMNEPRQTGNSNVAEWGDGNEDGGYTYNYLNQLNETFIKTVRANGSTQNSERLLMIPSYHATASKSPLMELVIPENSGNVAISVHAYEPYPFTMDTSQSKVWSGGYADWSGYQASYQTLLENTMSDLKTVSDSKKVPIIIGEFGASDFGNTQDRADWAKDYIKLAKKYGFVCVLWDNNAVYNGSNAGGENHGYINRSDYSLYESGKPVIDAIMEIVNSSVTDNFWDSFTVDNSWIEIKKYSSGKALTQWSGEKVTTDLTYLNDNYNICVVYSGENSPRAVLENAYDYAWYSVEKSQTGVNIAYYDYEDFSKVLDENNVTINDIGSFVVQATSQTTLYGVYAVPVEKDESDSSVTDNFWDSFTVDNSWIEIKKYSSGKALTQWSGEKVTTDLTYLNDNYNICVVYSGENSPRAVLENAYDYAWYSVEKSQTGVNIAYYDYEDFSKVLDENNVTINDIGNFVVQATSQTTLYGVYAVPVENDESNDCVHKDDDGDGYCEMCHKKIDGGSAQLLGYTLTLDGSIGVNFYMDLSDDIVNDADSYVKFKVNGKEQIVKVSEATKDSGYYVFPCYVPAPEMTKEITAQVFSGDFESTVYKFTVQDYAKYILDNKGDYSAETVALVKALLNYGTMAQKYFEVNTDKLANSILADTDKAISDVAVDDLANYKPYFDENIDEVGEFKTFYLTLNSTTNLNVTFKPAEGKTIDDYSFMVSNKVLTEDEVKDIVKVLDDGRFLFTFKNIDAKNLGEKVYIVATLKDSTAEKPYSEAVVSPLTYARQIVKNSATKDANLVGTMKAMYEFYLKAVAYDGANS